MKFSARDLSLVSLRLLLGAVVLVRSCNLVMHGSGSAAATWSSGSHILLLGWIEIVAAILFLVPPTLVVGAWGLVAVFVCAAAIHIAHGEFDVGGLMIWAVAALVVLVHRNPRPREAAPAGR
jgi:hypothetical protein